ncbi:MAG: diacylglycerol kinase family protein [Patescibacteria group bacterium]|nr:diacylglycerol kinase family protein [Patescibacteria group bacterium]
MKKFFKSFRYAFAGIVHALQNNFNLRFDFFVGIAVSLLAIALKIQGFEMGILGIMILLVISAEMINCSIEEMVNLITTEHRKEARIAKDVAAGMVLIAATGSVIVGLLIFIPHIIAVGESLWHFKFQP